ncbi:hypothetical protein [Gordonia sp. MMO-8]|uniref:hypothetical protein n=1 Tax=Gordonia sp. MMO-8 TaxID=3127886 RepID=UPI0030167393
MELTFTLDQDQAARAAVIACRDQGHDSTNCADQAAHIMGYAALMLSKHVEMTERQIAEEAARAQVVPFYPEQPAE